MKQISADLKNPPLLDELELVLGLAEELSTVVTEAATVDDIHIAATAAMPVSRTKVPALPDVLARANNTTSNNSFQWPREGIAVKMLLLCGEAPN